MNDRFIEMIRTTSFKEFVEHTGIEPAHLKAALEYLSQPKSDDEDHRAYRRLYCATVAKLIEGPSAMNPIKVRDHWWRWATHLEQQYLEAESSQEETRLIVLAEMARREQGELQDLIH